MSSRIPGFHRLSRQARVELVAQVTGLSAEECRSLAGAEPLDVETADSMIENAVGVFGLPLGIAANFLINGRDYFVPMVTEEPSVVAAASNAARLVRAGGGFAADATDSLMIGQIQLIDVADVPAAVARLRAESERLLERARGLQPRMVARGGGAREIEVEPMDDGSIAVHVIADVGDAMGANAINTLVEGLAPEIAAISGGNVNLRILSNLSDRRLARARAVIPFEVLAIDGMPGETVARRIESASNFAAASPHRAATHNKGVMNGIDAVAIATGNDWRAIEAGAHAYAARGGQYGPLAVWKVEGVALVGSLELPLAVGTVGDRIRLNPRAQLSLRVLAVANARELAQVMAAVGLGQNFAALRALATEGIQRGHMELHGRGASNGSSNGSSSADGPRLSA
ncbi:MAG TPA: hydroxymethylglutaryl-CoA reductase, degradative [Candidatus Binatia bacterium]|nr:hydroxymethylglutaryl-CoA reductase, degradative [Candidatus Binatia bacterium]